MDELRGRRVTVMGLGRFGGAAGAVRFLVQEGAEVLVTDLKPASELQETLAMLSDVPVRTWRLGEHRLEDVCETDLLVVNPAVPRNSPLLHAARSAGVRCTSEIILFWERNPARVIAVTGTAGKSTTAAMLHAMLLADGRRCWLGGNIGRSLLPELDQIRETDWVVLELSSFQLEDLAERQPRPHVAVVTNFAPNHLDRHGTLDAYRSAKQTLLRWQTSTQFAVLNCDDGDVATWPTAARRFWFGGHSQALEEGIFELDGRADAGQMLLQWQGTKQPIALREWLSLPGAHNVRNAQAAAVAALAVGLPLESIEAGLRGFRGLPHRLQRVAQRDGVDVYNDSKATTPDAARRALAAFHRGSPGRSALPVDCLSEDGQAVAHLTLCSPIVLLAGGSDKGIDLRPLVQAVVDSPVKAVGWLGETGPRLRQLLHEIEGEARPAPVFDCLEDAWNWATSVASRGDVILLSPGCASYDWYANYEERGLEFTRLAQAWSKG